MQATFEQALEIVSALPPVELRKLGVWIQSQQILQTVTDSKQFLVNQEIAKFKLAMKWIDDHRQDYLGQWVCLDGDRLIGAGRDALQVHQAAKARGIEIPFVVRIVLEPEFYDSGGIEMCP